MFYPELVASILINFYLFYKLSEHIHKNNLIVAYLYIEIACRSKSFEELQKDANFRNYLKLIQDTCNHPFLASNCKYLIYLLDAPVDGDYTYKVCVEQMLSYFKFEFV